MRKLLFFFAALLLLSSCIPFRDSAEISVIPKPVFMKPGSGFFTITPATAINAGPGCEEEANRLSEMICNAIECNIDRMPFPTPSRSIDLTIDPGLSRLGSEGYSLDVTPDKISIRSPEKAGLFYASQTLRQLLPVQIFSPEPVAGIIWKVPCVTVEDYPRFSWRGMHLDVSRHFMPANFVKRFIDLLAMHKMNRFHWHLTDDQGWRIEIKKYPKLTEIGSWRRESEIGYIDGTAVFDGRPHFGFYTQDEIRDIVEFAAQRHVMIIPEIEMPGHATAGIAAYPEYGTTDESVEVRTLWGQSDNVFNIKPETFEFLKDVLTEVMELFPGQYIHIGGDEAHYVQWLNDPGTLSIMNALGLETPEDVQSHFISQMDEFITSKSRIIIGWDEILKGGLAPNATVMCWTSQINAIKAAMMGHDVVQTPTEFTYFNSTQDMSPYIQNEPDIPLTIGIAYQFEPVPLVLNEEQAKHILGGQAQLWGEYITHYSTAEYRAFPRGAALAEALWTPKSGRNYKDFCSRLWPHLNRFDLIGINYHHETPACRIASWNESMFAAEPRTTLIVITKHVTGPGSYQVLFNRISGDAWLAIEKVELLKNGVTISVSEHYGVAENRNRDTAYNLPLAISAYENGAKYEIRYTAHIEKGEKASGGVALKASVLK
jgi:hexosaminidase